MSETKLSQIQSNLWQTLSEEARISHRSFRLLQCDQVDVYEGQTVVHLARNEIALKGWVAEIIYLAVLVRDWKKIETFQSLQSEGIDLAGLIEAIGRVVSEVIAMAIDAARLDTLKGATEALTKNALEYADTAQAGNPNLLLLELCLDKSAYMIEEARRLELPGFGCFVGCVCVRLALLEEAVGQGTRTIESLRRAAADYCQHGDSLLRHIEEATRKSYTPSMDNELCHNPPVEVIDPTTNPPTVKVYPNACSNAGEYGIWKWTFKKGAKTYGFQEAAPTIPGPGGVPISCPEPEGDERPLCVRTRNLKNQMYDDDQRKLQVFRDVIEKCRSLSCNPDAANAAN